MGKMRHLIAITETEDGYEGLLLCENGIVLKRETGEKGAEVFHSLSSVFPNRETFGCISGKELQVDAPKKRHILYESWGETALRAVFGETDGAVLFIGKRVHFAAKEKDTVREVRNVPYGKEYMANKAISMGLDKEDTWLRHALEERTALTKPLIPAYLATLPEEKRLKMANLIRNGAMRGDRVCLEIVKEALAAYCGALGAAMSGMSLPLFISGPPKEDMPVIRKAMESFLNGKITVSEKGMPPIYGSAYRAAVYSKKPPDEAFRRRFSETYPLFL